MVKKHASRLFDPIFVVLKIIFWIALYAGVASGLGGLNTDKGQFTMELPIVILSAMFLYYGLKGKIWLPSFFSIFPVLIFYTFMDYFYGSMGRVFQWIDLGELFEFIDVLPALYLAVLVGVVGLILVFLYVIFRRVSAIIVLGSLLPFIATALWMLISPITFVGTFNQLSYRVQYWSLDKNVKDNGRWMTTLYYEAKRKIALEQIQQEPGWLVNDFEQMEKALSQLDKRNIYIMVMESLLDPTLFTSIEFPKGYLTPWMENLKDYRNFSTSPVYGGSTAQAEFEVLCGVPAYALFGGIEFNSFSGSPTSCLPNWFNIMGRRTVAQNAFKPSYFNQVKSYEGLGFKEMYFPKEYSSRSNTHLVANVTEESGPYMFDGDFFDQALSFYLTDIPLKQVGLNYMLDIYGHFPFYLDPNRFKSVISLEDTEFESVNDIANQYFYRTRAVESAVTSIYKRDPDAMVLVVSDHLPAIEGSVDQYKAMGYSDVYKNVYYLWDKGEPIKIDSHVNHYDLIWLVLSRMLPTQCLEENCFPLSASERYEQVMAHAMRLSGPDVSRFINKSD
jgi:phosphoglycerol transferase MdoB-like AlkP superfamily enzyme